MPGVPITIDDLNAALAPINTKLDTIIANQDQFKSNILENTQRVIDNHNQTLETLAVIHDTDNWLRTAMRSVVKWKAGGTPPSPQEW